MADTSFFWHDYETFGVLPRRDRPAQFAGIRTDASLNEIGEPLMCYCRPAPDYLPDPDSCLLTGILPQTCLERGLPEPAFAAAIAQALATPGTVGVGYNTLRFDDEVTRHLFWRNLIDPYGREWQNGCGRWDLLDVVRCMYALRPEGIAWPQHEDGRPSFRLEHLTAANGLAHDAAHDALSDVRATIALARLVRERQPKLWGFCLALRKKDAVLAEIDLAHPRPFLHVSGMYPAERGCIAVVWPLGPHPLNKNEVIVWDLSGDPALLNGLSAEQVRERLFTRTEALPEGVARLPIKTIHINRSPVVIGNLRTLSPDMAARWGIDMPAALRHAEQLRRGRPLAALFRQVYAPAEQPPADVDESLYSGFIANGDRKTLEHLRSLSPDALAQARVSFTDPRLEEMLFRYRARNYPETLDDTDRARWAEHCAARLHEGAGGARTLTQFFDRIDMLAEAVAEAGDTRGEAILGALYDYAEQIAPPA